VGSLQAVIIIGGGIVGLALAYRLSVVRPWLRLTVLEKEAEIASHQSGHNSGVLHSGIYYKPGSLKAATCVRGRREMIAFCETEGIPYRICGKTIVATNDAEVVRLQRLFERGLSNGLTCTMLEREGLAEIEPHATAVKAIHVAETGVVDFRSVCAQFAYRLSEVGHSIVTSAKVIGVREANAGVTLITTAGEFGARYIINCAGLYSDKVASLASNKPNEKIIPFRGEYYRLTPEASYLCRGLIYPVPDPRFPFLGIHLTRRVSGEVECGPNAVLAFAKEGYTKSSINPSEFIGIITFPGFLRLAAHHWRYGLQEAFRSLSRRAFVNALRKLIPEVEDEMLERAPAGVRAQAVSRTGEMLDDFVIRESARTIDVISAPSPAATASLAIADSIIEILDRKM